MKARVFMLMLSSLALTHAASAQPATQPGSSMQGFQMNRDQPVKIESNSLEVRDKQRQATFLGNVKLTQGDTVLQCQALVIFYEDSGSTSGAKKAAPPPTAQKSAPGTSQIKRAEAKGSVLVTQKDQTAKGDAGVFDVKSNSIALTGNVVVTQGANVLRGEKMTIDLNTGVTRVDSNTKQRVEGLFNPSSTPQSQAAPAPPPQNSKPAAASQKDAKPAPAPGKQGPGQPIRIN